MLKFPRLEMPNCQENQKNGFAEDLSFLFFFSVFPLEMILFVTMKNVSFSYHVSKKVRIC